MPTSEHYEALRREAEQSTQALEALTARLQAAKADKTAKAKQLSAAQEEHRRAGLFSPRRGTLKAEIARLTSAYTAVTKEIASLTEQVEQARTQAARHQRALADCPREQPAAPVPEDTPEPVRRVPPKAAPRTRARASLRPAASPEEQTRHLLDRLEQFYPEHQVFALDSISSDLRMRLLLLAKSCGYATIPEWLEAQGWQSIRGEAVRALRLGKYCTPGEEPAVIRPQVESMLRRLAACYPDRVIPHSIQRDHKSLSQDITGLYQWLGYGSVPEMLSAYGYRYLAATKGGRPATDAGAIFQALREAYPGRKPVSVQQVMQEHPEYAPALKTLQNRAPALFGMSLRRKLEQEEILARGA